MKVDGERYWSERLSGSDSGSTFREIEALQKPRGREMRIRCSNCASKFDHGDLIGPIASLSVGEENKSR